MWLCGGFGGGLEEFVDEGLVGFVLLRREAAKLREQARMNANGDELFGLARSRTANAAGALQFFVGRLRNIREINSAAGNRLCVPCGLLAAR